MEIVIETERIILRQFTIEDAAAVYTFGSHDEVNRYTCEPGVKNLKEAKKIITDTWIKDYKKYGYGRWAIYHKADSKVIGFAGLKYLEELKETDIGYRFLPEYWGKGIATEAGKQIIKYGFEELGLEKVIGITMKENIASYKVLEKIGLTFYKIDQYLCDGGKHRWYKLDKKDYL